MELLNAFREALDAHTEYSKALSAYEGYEWGYDGQEYQGRLDNADKRFQAALNATIDERVTRLLSSKSKKGFYDEQS